MARDPYKYFRIEARELADGLAKGVLALERIAGSPPEAMGEELGNLLRLAHTLKGAARVVRAASIADDAHAFEELLAPHRGAQAAVLEKAGIAPMLARLDSISRAIAALDAPPPAPAAPASLASQPPAQVRSQPAPPRSAPRLVPDTMRVELGEMDALLRSVSETAVQLSALRRVVAQLDEKTQRKLDSAVEQVERELVQVRDTVDRLRLLPASTLLGSLERAVRDAAESLGKQAELRASMGDHRLEAQVLARMGEALLHVVRNAVAHGIERPEDRRARGKPAAGVVELLVERRGRNVVFTCKDDGRGLDLEAIRRVAVQRGLLGADEARGLDESRAVELLLRGGLSTTPVADSTSGRGVGLDVVRAVVAEVRGKISVKSAAGRGTSVELSVPVSLTALSALQAVAGGQTVLIALAAVKEVLRVDDARIALSSERASIDYEGEPIPCLQLWRALRRPDPDGEPGALPSAGMRARSVLIVRSESSLTAVLVDRLLGVAEVIARPLPAMPVDPIVTGASFDADGNPCLLLDPAGLALAARSARPAPREAAAPRPPILIIDDSLTTRMLEQSILESAGYQVELATSAEEGLEKARANRYGLFLVDVEMPGMNGFEFVAQTQADPRLRDTPAMLVSSRNAPDDLRRGKEAGARAYIVKGEFDQRLLLQTIRQLVG